MTRSRAEIMRDLQAIVAELAYVYGDDTAGVGTDDISPKLAKALNREATDPAGQMALGHQTRVGHHGETRHTHEDIRAKALNQTLPPTIVGGTRETHEDIRAKARAYKPSDYSAGYDEPGVRRSQRYDEPGIPEKPERLKDYTPADDAQWDEAVFLGTGDRSEP